MFEKQDAPSGNGGCRFLTPRTRIPFIAAGLLTMALASAGCGGVSSGRGSALSGDGSSSRSSGSTSADGGPCSLVAKGDVSTVVGYEITRTDGTSSGSAGNVGIGSGICVFQPAGEGHSFTVQTFNGQKEMELQLQLKSGAETINGLGDEAFWSWATAMLFVRKGDHAVAFINGTDWALDKDHSDAHRDAMIGLAKKALPKL